MGNVLIHHNPFCLSQNVEKFEVDNPISIRDFLDQKGIVEFEKPTICIINGDPVLRAHWSVVCINDDTIVNFLSLPQGGGGGGGGSKILRTVLTIAVAVVAPYAGAAIATSLGVTSAIGTALITAAVGFAGNALVSALIPPPKPGGFQSNYNTTQASPTYSLQAQGNQARLGEPIPVIYGRHIIYPDFAATPHAEYINNEQFLYQLHCVGQGEYDIEQLRIEDTPISSFEEITYEIISPGNDVTLFNPDVVTSPEIAGQELTAVVDAGDWTGPFIVNPSETQTNEIAVDIALPRGLYYANDSGGLSDRTVSWSVEARLIDDEGEPVNDWINLGDHTITDNDNTALRYTYKYPVALGRYEVRAIRTNAKDTNSRVGNEIRWEALKATLDVVNDFGDVTLLAMKMRATDNLSQTSSRKINIIATRKIPVWDGSNWSAPQASRSIAWAFADIFRAHYGADLSDDRLDLQKLYDLDQVWSSRGDYFDVVFDQKLTVWDAAKRVAQCGRAAPYQQGGIVQLVRDEPKTMPIALFSPRNITSGSFSVEYLMPSDETADSITVEFFNNKTWKQDEVTVSLPGSTTDKPAKVVLYGCTNKEHAMREGYYLAAANQYRRRLTTFTTELEGLIPSYGDLIAIAHDLPSWGVSGDVAHFDFPSLRLAEPVTFEDEGDHFIALRRLDGSISGPWPVTKGIDNYHVVLEGPLDFTPYTGAEKERTHFTFGTSGEKFMVHALVRALRPRGDSVEVSAVIENASVHTADNNV